MIRGANVMKLPLFWRVEVNAGKNGRFILNESACDDSCKDAGDVLAYIEKDGLCTNIRNYFKQAFYLPVHHQLLST